MYVVTLRFAGDRSRAAAQMEAHNAWLAAGFSDGVFVMNGTLQPKAGGVILAHGEDRAALEARIAADPFVAEGIVAAEILEVAPGRTDARLAFLAGEAA